MTEYVISRCGEPFACRDNTILHEDSCDKCKLLKVESEKLLKKLDDKTNELKKEMENIERVTEPNKPIISRDAIEKHRLLDHCWHQYQQGQACADYTDREVFNEVIGNLIDHLRKLAKLNGAGL